MRKHITVRNIIDNATEEEAIDQTIAHALELLTQQAGVPMDLVSASPSYRRDGVGFVTVVAEQSAQPMAPINWTVQDGQNVVEAQQ